MKDKFDGVAVNLLPEDDGWRVAQRDRDEEARRVDAIFLTRSHVRPALFRIPALAA
jgi:hypothetical protein